mgnify:CR=1 FL=1
MGEDEGRGRGGDSGPGIAEGVQEIEPGGRGGAIADECPDEGDSNRGEEDPEAELVPHGGGRRHTGCRSSAMRAIWTSVAGVMSASGVVGRGKNYQYLIRAGAWLPPPPDPLAVRCRAIQIRLPGIVSGYRRHALRRDRGPVRISGRRGGEALVAKGVVVVDRMERLHMLTIEVSEEILPRLAALAGIRGLSPEGTLWVQPSDAPGSSWRSPLWDSAG